MNNEINLRNWSLQTRLIDWQLRGKPTQRAVNWDLAIWVSTFPQHEAFLVRIHTKHFGRLNRQAVRSIVYEANSLNLVIEGFLAVMIWGYAADARGPWRVDRILNQPELIDSLMIAIKCLEAGQLDLAYQALVNQGPKYLGPAFATKYLYFSGNLENKLQPLIMDSIISAALKDWTDFKINVLTASSKEYVSYLIFMAELSDYYNLSAAELEEFLFTEYAGILKNSFWSSRSNNSMMNKVEVTAFSFLLASELLAKDSQLIAYYSEPGGGQYQCLSIRNIDPMSPVKIDLNWLGSIHFHDPSLQRLQWSDLVEIGVVECAEIVTTHLRTESKFIEKKVSNQAKSFRYLATLINEHKMDDSLQIRPGASDNSAYGISQLDLDQGLITSHPNLLDLPPHAWFWTMESKNFEPILLDTFAAQIIRKNQTESID
jgi:hypothetical protein